MGNGTSFRFRGPLAVFLYCLIIAGSLWLVIRLSGTYNSGVHLQLRFVNIPENYALVQPVDSVVTIKLHAQGFKILSLEFFSIPKPLYIDVSKIRYEKSEGRRNYKLNMNKLTALVMEMNDIQSEFIGFEPDTIYFKADPITRKKVSVIPLTNLQFEKGYEADGPIIVKPDSVELFGTANQLLDIFVVKTTEVSLKKLNKSQEIEVEIQKPMNGKVNVKPGHVKLLIGVKQMPE